MDSQLTELREEVELLRAENQVLKFENGINDHNWRQAFIYREHLRAQRDRLIKECDGLREELSHANARLAEESRLVQSLYTANGSLTDECIRLEEGGDKRLIDECDKLREELVAARAKLDEEDRTIERLLGDIASLKDGSYV